MNKKLLIVWVAVFSFLAGMCTAFNLVARSLK